MNFKYNTLITLRSPSGLFWGIAFPIILITVFSVGFSGVLGQETEIESIPIAVSQEYPFAYILEQIEMLDVEYISDISKSKEALKTKSIVGIVDENGDLLVLSSGRSQSILASIMDSIMQSVSMGEDALYLDFTKDYVNQGVVIKNAGIEGLTFTVILMVAAYAGFVTLETFNLTKANQSAIGARVQISGHNPYKTLISNLLFVIVYNALTLSIVILYTEFVLGINLINNLFYSAIILFSVSIYGAGLGLAVGSIKNLSIDAKTGVLLGCILFLSSLSGMMGPIKYSIIKNLPWLHSINPLSVGHSHLLRINFLNNYEGLWWTVLYLTLFGLAFMLFAIIKLRREKYDNL